MLFGPAPPKPADILSLHIYVNSFVNWNFGLGSAMSVLLLLFLLIVSVVWICVFRIGGERLRETVPPADPGGGAHPPS